jgi:hypothetical protein
VALVHQVKEPLVVMDMMSATIMTAAAVEVVQERLEPMPHLTTAERAVLVLTGIALALFTLAEAEAVLVKAELLLALAVMVVVARVQKAIQQRLLLELQTLAVEAVEAQMVLQLL